MVKLRTLMEDAFKQKVQDTYDAKLKGKVHFRLSDFDRDALELGVLHELHMGRDFAQALYHAMWHLHKNPSRYDDVDDFGRDGDECTVRTNQATWTGGAGIARG